MDLDSQLLSMGDNYTLTLGSLPFSNFLPQHCELKAAGSPLPTGHTLVSAFGEDGQLSEILKILFHTAHFLVCI